VTRYNQTARTPLINRAYAAANEGGDADELREILGEVGRSLNRIKKRKQSLETAEAWLKRRIEEIENGNEAG
jgi:hypothetical protein